MFFRNVIFFRIPAETVESLRNASELDAALNKNVAQPVGALQISSRGWEKLNPESSNDALPYWSGFEYVGFALGGEDRILPTVAVKSAVAKRIDEIQKNSDQPLGKRRRDEIKAGVLAELIPRSLTKPYRLEAFADLVRGLLVINTSSPKAAEALISKLRDSLGSFKAYPLFAWSPSATLTTLLEDEPLPFYIGDECELQDQSGDGGIIKLQRYDLTEDSIAYHLRDGKTVNRLGLNFANHLSMTIDDCLVIRKLKFLNAAVEKLETTESESLETELDARFCLMVGELGQLFDALEKMFKIDKLDGAK